MICSIEYYVICIRKIIYLSNLVVNLRSLSNLMLEQTRGGFDPYIFKIFLNDLNISIESSGIGVTLLNKNIGCLLYADDLVLIPDSKNGLQKQLNILNEYCTEWSLSVKISKTKVIIFNKTGKLVQDIFHIENQAIECVTSYKYLGIMLQASGKFTQARKMIYNKALKGMF